MKYGERDGSGRFAKKATQENDATTGTTETEQEQKQEGVTIAYCDSIEGVGAQVDNALASLGIVGVGAEVNKTLASLGLAIVESGVEGVSELINM